ncbi:MULTISPECIES: helix-turn-helix transcriptional regulator [unclassified Clostridium]|uniref:helix-turn-helix domain-containing protein n=1 Tax=unclassified Clostridium TaxID=2614128 RepID=UPI0002979EC2|nr:MULTISPECIES: helix-turn-helix transcriptional regulator [unclassified Clostridium]EKQ56329.1 MAG: putative transcriptional regulator [Clostridium sp. Maddingley MBC34-26]
MVGDKIKQQRENHNLSLRKLAVKSDISPSYLYYIEKGISKNPSINVLQKIANALGVEVTSLLDTA